VILQIYGCSVDKFCLPEAAGAMKSHRVSRTLEGTFENSTELLGFIGKVKVKCTLVRALRLCTGRTAHRGSRGISLLFHDHGTRRGEEPASRPGRSLPPRKTRCPLYKRMGGPQSRSGQVRKISSPPGFDPRTVQPVVSRYTGCAPWPSGFHRKQGNSRNN
jgi:hypothetical protein